MQSPGYQGMRQHPPATLQAFAQLSKLTPTRQGECPEEQRQGSAEHEERRGNEHQHFMLDHVRGEEHSSKRMQRGDECYPKRTPSTPKGHVLPPVYPMRPRRGMPQYSPATQVKAGNQDEAPDDPGIPAPGRPGYRWRCLRERMRQHRRRRRNEGEAEEGKPPRAATYLWHGVRIK